MFDWRSTRGGVLLLSMCLGAGCGGGPAPAPAIGTPASTPAPPAPSSAAPGPAYAGLLELPETLVYDTGDGGTVKCALSDAGVPGSDVDFQVACSPAAQATCPAAGYFFGSQIDAAGWEATGCYAVLAGGVWHFETCPKSADAFANPEGAGGKLFLDARDADAATHTHDDANVEQKTVTVGGAALPVVCAASEDAGMSKSVTLQRCWSAKYGVVDSEVRASTAGENECHTRGRLVAVEPGVAAPPAAAGPVKGTLELVRAIPAGKWPEGVVVVGDAAWIAESGSRRVERVSLDGDGLPAQVAVGRLPVDIGVGPDGAIYTVAQTDRTLWRIDATKAGGQVVARVGDCPQAMALGGGAAWVLQWRKCASDGSSVARVDLATHAVVTSPETGANAWSIAHALDRAWVATSAAVESVSGKALGEVRRVDGDPGSDVARHVVAGPHGLYATTRDGVVRIDPAQAGSTAKATLSEPVYALSADGDAVLAMGRKGTLWVLDATTLAVQKELAPPAGIDHLEPHAVARWGDRVVVTDHGADGEHGRLLVLALPR